MRPGLAVALWMIWLPLAGGCASDRPEGLPVSREPGRGRWEPAFGDAIVVQRSDYVMIPFALQQSQVQGQAGFAIASQVMSFSPSVSLQSGVGFQLAQSSGGYYSTGGILWNNVVFCRKNGAESHLLLDRKAVICKSWLPDPSRPKGHEESKYLFFGIADQDTNGDGYLNGDDAVILYLCDLSGGGLTRLTPQGTQLADIQIDGNDTAYARILRKPPGTKEFGPDAQSLVLRIDLHQPGEGTPIPDEELREKALSIVTRK